MSAFLSADNFNPANIQEKSYIAADVTASATPVAITAKSSQGMSANQYLLVGNQGQEKTELVKISSISGNAITVPALTYDHVKYDSLLCLKYNQIRFYRAANVDGTVPADGSFALFTGSTVDIDPDDLTTRLVDSTGSSSYWYKANYYNSTTAAESAIADAVAFRGSSVGIGDRYATLDAIRQEAGLKSNVYITDSLVDEKRTAAEDEVNAALGGMYDTPFSPAPGIITQITEMLAAGFLLIIDYGTFATGTNKDGQAKIDEARAMLKKIQTGETQLTDASGAVIASISRVEGWPTDETAQAEAEDNGGDRLFRISDRF